MVKLLQSAIRNKVVQTSADWVLYTAQQSLLRALLRWLCAKKQNTLILVNLYQSVTLGFRLECPSGAHKLLS